MRIERTLRRQRDEQGIHGFTQVVMSEHVETALPLPLTLTRTRTRTRTLTLTLTLSKVVMSEHVETALDSLLQTAGLGGLGSGFWGQP